MPYDFPSSAYTKACQVIDAFDALAVEYLTLLNTQRALLANGNYDGIDHHASRSDALARHAAAYGRQMRSIRIALESGLYVGTRTNELLHHFERAEIRGHHVANASAHFARDCARLRDTAESELRADSGVGGRRNGGSDVYRAFDQTSFSVDIAR